MSMACWDDDEDEGEEEEKEEAEGLADLELGWEKATWERGDGASEGE